MDQKVDKIAVSSSYRFKLCLSKQIDREFFLSSLWDVCDGLIGVHEGTLLSEEAHTLGLETESWLVDSAEAPPSRDWMKEMDWSASELFFDHYESAKQAQEWLKSIENEQQGLALKVTEIEEVPHQDWDREWKESFQGIFVPPYWKVLPPHRVTPAELHSKEQIIVINPGAGFGTGTHETTQLCLTQLGQLSFKLGKLGESAPFGQKRALDFGSGSGILSLALAYQGYPVTGVEIDPLACQNARDNLELNRATSQFPVGMSSDRMEQVHFYLTLEESESDQKTSIYDVVVANILRPVLIQYAEALVSRLNPQGWTLILSGLIASDVDEVLNVYSQQIQQGFLLNQLKLSLSTQVMEQGEWRCIVFKATALV